MTDDLDTLRPEVRRAASFLDSMACSADEEAAVKTIRAELLRLTDENARLLAANRDAMDHFEQMKAELAALTKKCTCSRRSVSSPFGCRVCNPQLEIADLESKLATSEAELAALKARIADAPRVYHSSFEYTLDASTLYARAVGIPGEETYALVKVED